MAEQSTTNRITEELEEPSLLDRVIAESSTHEFFKTLRRDPATMLDYVKLCCKSLRIGKGTPVEQESAALICAQQMLAEDITFAQLRQKYHIYPDGLDHRAEWVHAEIGRRGWEWTWKSSQDDADKAIFSATKNGVTHEVTYTMAMARKAGDAKQGSGYDKRPSSQLRARAITTFATMWLPEIGAGTSDDTEFRGSVELDGQSKIVKPQPVAVDEKPRTAETKTAKTTTQSTPEDAETKTESATVDQPREITLDSRASAIDFPKRAFTAFAHDPQIVTLRDLVQYTREQLKSRGGLGEITLDEIEEKLAEHKFGLAPDPSPEETTSEGETDSSDASKDESPTEAAPDAAAGSISKAQRGEAIAEIMQLCNSDGELKKRLTKTLAEEFGKSGLGDCNDVQLLIALACLLAIKSGVADDRIKTAVSNVLTDPDPIVRVQGNIENLRARLGN